MQRNLTLAFRTVLTVSMMCASLAAAQAAVVDFEDLPLAANSHWNGPAANSSDEPDPFGGPLPVKAGTFTSGGVTFGNKFNPNWGNWSGFGYSNRTDNTTPGFGNQFSAFTGTGAGAGNDNYGVVFGYVDGLNPSDPIQFGQLPYLEFDSPVNLASAAITNMTYAALLMRDGDENGFAKKFGGESGNDPDWFKLTVYATDAAGNLSPSTVEFYLADFRGDSASDYIVDQWVTLDLSVFQNVTKLHFNLESSDVSFGFMNTPGTFAIDNLTFNPVPEPGTFLLATLAALALLPIARHRNRG
jgi:hypothetical protein